MHINFFWLVVVLPTMNRDLIPSDPTAADYIEEESEKEDYCDTDDVMPTDSGDPSPSLDEGLGTDPKSVSSNSQNVSPDGCSVSASNDEGVGTIGSPQSSAVSNSQNRDSDLTPCDQPLASSAGQNDTNPGLTPSDQPQTEEQEGNTNPLAKPTSEGIENVPVLDIGVDDDDDDDDDDDRHPIRRSIRQALKVCQLEQEINVRYHYDRLHCYYLFF
ncbi:transcription elongation factor SPT5-like [Stegodyphus dumicola]|uniref:transcription elongation factor SPT5-like n=1 Tax=Stegodyphus dumicola TaxID=202533 RepID=UPI0015AF1F8A|nr:transcription elongation factor SPT5-like [Stegodyphus dumicola]